MMFMEWIRKLTDIIMPLEPPQTDEEVKEIKKAEAEEVKSQQQPAPQPVQADKQPSTGGGYNQNYGGTMNFTRNGGMVSTSDNGVTSMGGVRYEAFNSGNSETSVKPSLAVVKTPQLTLKIYSPTKFDDQVKDIADDLLKRNAVIVNFEGVGELEQQRIGDFIIGAVYTIDGRAEVVSNKILLYVPKEIEYETAAATLSAARRRYH
jgi:cell division inhibitor SepF